MEIPKYSALQIAKYFIKQGQKEAENKLTPLKLQKILYYAQGWYLANYDKPLFKDVIQAWKLGPAIYSIYKAFERYGNTPIKENIDDDEINMIGKDDREFLNKIWSVYKKYSASDLIDSTHSEKPWISTRLDIKANENTDAEINLTVIRDYFKELISQ